MSSPHEPSAAEPMASPSRRSSAARALPTPEDPASARARGGPGGARRRRGGRKAPPAAAAHRRHGLLGARGAARGAADAGEHAVGAAARAAHAVCAKDVARATALCADGHGVDVEDEHGFTPLHNAAALAGAVGAQLATLLLEKRADVHRKDNEQYTCLHWASAINNIATVELLRRRKPHGRALGDRRDAAPPRRALRPRRVRAENIGRRRRRGRRRRLRRHHAQRRLRVGLGRRRRRRGGGRQARAPQPPRPPRRPPRHARGRAERADARASPPRMRAARHRRQPPGAPRTHRRDFGEARPRHAAVGVGRQRRQPPPRAAVSRVTGLRGDRIVGIRPRAARGLATRPRSRVRRHRRVDLEIEC